jgi:hypothetical protein
MTPSEKKARADIVSEIIQESNRYEDGVISSDQFLGFLNEALDAAERRGFERAKKRSMEVMSPMLRDMISRGKASDLIQDIKFEDEVSDGVRGGDLDP